MDHALSRVQAQLANPDYAQVIYVCELKGEDSFLFPEPSENALLDVLLILSMFSEFIEDWNSASWFDCKLPPPMKISFGSMYFFRLYPLLVSLQKINLSGCCCSFHGS